MKIDETNIKCKLSYIIPLLLICVSCSYSKRNIKTGSIIVEKIEEYRTINDTLPISLADFGQSNVIDDVMFCYERIDSVNYMVWFGTTLGEGVYYYSDSRKWEKRLRKIGDPIRVDL